MPEPSQGHSERRIQIADDLDIVAARVEGRNLAREMGFGIIDQARIATAISELARNVVLYAQRGEILLSRIGSDSKAGLQIICRDQGPGIKDVAEVMRRPSAVSAATAAPGLQRLPSQGSGAEGRDISDSGMGLSGTARLMDEFEIVSEVGVGTTVMARRWLRLTQPYDEFVTE